MIINKNTKSSLWLDLELRKDIDDFITLVFAIENEFNVTEISIHNPSTLEIILLNSILFKFKKNIPIIVSGSITEYSDNDDIHDSLKSYLNYSISSNFTYFKDYKITDDFNNKIFFCGGSLYTLASLLKLYPHFFINAYVQGGYAGSSIVGEENTLKKFRKRESVPTWNLNLDLESTDFVLSSNNVNCHFVSKNVCHSSFVSVSDLSEANSFFNNVLINYFEKNKFNDKCMHDLVAFFSIFNSDIIKFKNVTLERSNDSIPKWKSLNSNNKNFAISYYIDLKMFKNFVKF